jgi:hypothetical protein
MEPLKRYSIKFTDLTDIDIGVIAVEFTVSAFSPAEAEDYALRFAHRVCAADFEMITTLEVHSLVPSLSLTPNSKQIQEGGQPCP